MNTKKQSSVNKQERTVHEQEIHVRQYGLLINDYIAKWREVKKILFRSRKRPGDDELLALMGIVDEERHKIHLQLLSVGSELGFDKNRVLGDVLRRAKNLEEYNLSDFAVFSPEYTPCGDNIRPGHVYVIYNIKDSDINGGIRQERGNRVVPTINSIILEERLSCLYRKIKHLNVDWIDFPDGFTHDTNHTYQCLEVPDKHFDAFVSFIRDHNEFRVDSSYFSSEEVTTAMEAFEMKFRDFLTEYVGNNEEMIRELTAKFNNSPNEAEKKIVLRLIQEHLNV